MGFLIPRDARSQGQKCKAHRVRHTYNFILAHKRKAPGFAFVSGAFLLSMLSWLSFCDLEGKLAVIILERPDDHVHAHLHLFRFYAFVEPGEKL
jgi:hypothetical protein